MSIIESDPMSTTEVNSGVQAAAMDLGVVVVGNDKDIRVSAGVASVEDYLKQEAIRAATARMNAEFDNKVAVAMAQHETPFTIDPLDGSRPPVWSHPRLAHQTSKLRYIPGQ